MRSNGTNNLPSWHGICLSHRPSLGIIPPEAIAWGHTLDAIFTCPKCGGVTNYDPFQCTSRGQREEVDGKPYWCLYVLVTCSHCGQGGKVLWKRDEIQP